MGFTIAEKILASHAGLDGVKPGQIVIAEVDRTRVLDIMILEIADYMDDLGIDKVWDPDRVVLPIEHQVPACSEADAQSHIVARQFAKKYGLKHFYDIGNHGICHVLFEEEGFARPGELVAANGSHTAINGAFNVAARGIGAVEMVYLLKHGRLWFKVPETVRFEVNGTLPFGVYSKDIVLFVTATYGTDVARYKSAEFVGETIQSMSLESRLTIANMGAEIGAKFALFEADDKVINYVKNRTNEPFTPVKSDNDANFSETIEINVDRLEPYVACPHDLENSMPVGEVEGIAVDQAFIGSCASGRIEDLRIAATMLKNRSIAKGTRLLVIPASMKIYKQALKENLLEVFIEAGAMIEGPCCGPCGGGCKGILGSGERCISTTNRNYKGRMGSIDSEVYLASTATVVASAIAGCITDPRPFLLKEDS